MMVMPCLGELCNLLLHYLYNSQLIKAESWSYGCAEKPVMFITIEFTNTRTSVTIKYIASIYLLT